MKFFYLVVFFFIGISLFGQNPPSQAALDKLIRENKELQEQMKKNPELAEMMKKALEQEEEENTLPALVRSGPKKAVAKLAAIPTKIFTKGELISWASKSYQSLFGKLTVQQQSKYLAALEACGNDARKMEDASILNWIKKSPKPALLFAMKAVMQDGDPDMYWNNLAAMLNLTGNEDKAIIPLNYLLKKYPSTSIVLNNLGQAYLGLGDLDKAKQYFDSCLKYNPNHPEANHSMGLIYRFKGNSIKSNYHFEKETRVCYKKPVVEELDKVKTDEELFKITRSKFLKPENYFNKLGLNQFIVPPLPSSIDESNQWAQAHKNFRENVQAEIQKWAALDINLAMNPSPVQQQKSIYSELIGTVFLPHLEKEKDKNINSWMEIEDVTDITYPTLGSIASREGQLRSKKFEEDMMKINIAHRFDDSVQTHRKMIELEANPGNTEAIQHKYEQLRIETAMKYCQQEITLIDKFLQENATSQPRGFEERTNAIIELLNEAMSYKSLAPHDVNVALQAHNLVQVYLVYLDNYSSAAVIAGTKKNGYTGAGPRIYCDMKELEAMKYELAETNFIDAACPYKIVIPLVVAKVSFNCEKVEVEGGEILIAGVEYEFKTGNTTLAIGPGAGADLPFISVGAKNQAFVTFDRDGNYSDSGIKGEVGIEVSHYLDVMNAEIESMAYGPTLEAKAGYEFSINSGASAKTEIGGKEIPISF